MREALRTLVESDYWVYGLTEADFEYTVRLTESVIERQERALMEEERRTREEHPYQEADDMLDDNLYYARVETDYLWHFCLWRLQAVLEGLVVHKFLPEPVRSGLVGLRKKLLAIRSAGYSLSDSDYDDLISWGRVRNALSHAPPEQYRPGSLGREDIQEYQRLVTRLCETWRAEQEVLGRRGVD